MYAEKYLHTTQWYKRTFKITVSVLTRMQSSLRLSLLYFQMFPQIGYLKGCIFTLTAIAFLLCGCLTVSSKRLKMYRQLFSSSLFRCLLKSHAWWDAKPHWLHLFDLPPVCVFKCFFKSLGWWDAQLHL